MADQLGAAVLTLSVDDAQFNAGLQRAQANAQAAGSKVGQAFDGFSAALKGLAGFAGIVGIGAVTQQIIATGQASERSKVQLSALAGAYGESQAAAQAAARTAQVLGISTLDAREGFAQLYASLRGTGLGLKQLEVLFVGVSNAARLSGAGTQEAQAALLQLRQGLASGRLQGDELRSVLEQLPALAQAIAAELKVNVGALRQLGSDGQITSDIIFRAAQKLATATAPGRTQVEQLGIAYKNLRETAAEAFGPALLTVITNVTAGIAAFSQYVRENKESLANFAIGVVNVVKTLAPLVAGIMAVQAAFKAWQLAAKGVALAQAAVLALQGPKGWAVLALAAGATAVAYKAIEEGLKGIEQVSGKARKEASKAIAEFKNLLGTTSLNPAADPTVDKKLRAQLQLQATEQALALQGIERQIAAAKELAAAEAGVVREQIQQRQEIEAGVLAARERVQLIGAQIDALRQQGKDDPAQLSKLVNEQQLAAADIRLKLIEGATALRDAGKRLSDDLRRATLDLAGIRNDSGGLNSYLPQQLQQERAQSSLALLLPAFREAQARFVQLTGQQAPEFNGPASLVVDSVRQFIDRTNREFDATKAVVDTQAALAETSKALVSINERLASVTERLADKDWNVAVNVSGGAASVYGDAVNRSLS